MTMDKKSLKTKTANSLLKSIGRIPLTYKGQNKLVWGDSLNICLYKVKEGILKLEYGYALNKHEYPAFILYTMNDEIFDKLDALFSRQIEVVELFITDERFLYVAKVVADILLHANDMKSGSQT